MSKIIHLFHGTTVFFDQPDLEKAKLYKDFGKGFYLTTYFSQAEQWAIRNLPENKINSYGYIYEYSFDMENINSLNCLELLTYDEAWVKTITWYRNNLETEVKYDLIYDRIADGKYRELIDVLQRYDRKLLKFEDVLKIARFKDAKNDQYCFKTPKALEHICRLRYATVYNHKGAAKVIKWYNMDEKGCVDE